MNSFFVLLKMNLLNMLAGLKGGLRGSNGKISVSRIALYIMVCAGFAVMGGMLIFAEYTMFNLMSAIGQERLLMGLVVMACMIMTLVFGVFQTLTGLYFGRDIPAMAHLPLPSRTIMAAKWMQMYLTELMTSVLFITPLAVLYGLHTGGGVLYVLRCMMVILSVPLLPMAIALLLSSLLGRITALTRNKEAWMVIGTIVMLVLVLGSEWLLLPKIPEDADGAFFLRLLLDNEALLKLIIGTVPPVMWAVEALSGSWSSTLLLSGTGLLAISGLIWILGAGYMNVCLSHTEQGSHRRRKAARDEGVRMRSPLMALFHREMNEVFKSPIYLMNGVLGVLMLPIMLMGMSVGMSSGAEGMSLQQALAEGLTLITRTDLTLILAALLSFMCWMCPLPCTSVSREGRRLQITRMIPVPARTILMSKVLVNMAVVGAGTLLMGGVLVYLLGTEYVLEVVGAVVMANVMSWSVTVANLVCDVIRPVLEWKSEQEVMKQNMNVLTGMAASTLLIVLCAAPAVLLAIFADVSAFVRLLSVCGVLLLEAVGMLLLLRFVAEPHYAALEP